jgi:peptidoglycan hydrolase CwlO-like protein
MIEIITGIVIGIGLMIFIITVNDAIKESIQEKQGLKNTAQFNHRRILHLDIDVDELKSKVERLESIQRNQDTEMTEMKHKLKETDKVG